MPLRFFSTLFKHSPPQSLFSALYELPVSHIHIGGPEELFASNKKVTDGIFEQLKAVNAVVADATGKPGVDGQGCAVD